MLSSGGSLAEAAAWKCPLLTKTFLAAAAQGQHPSYPLQLLSTAFPSGSLEAVATRMEEPQGRQGRPWVAVARTPQQW